MDRNWVQIENEPDTFLSYLKAKAYSIGLRLFFLALHLLLELVKLTAVAHRPHGLDDDLHPKGAAALGGVISDYLSIPFLFNLGFKQQSGLIFVRESI